MLLSGDLVLWDLEVSLEDRKEIGTNLALLGELSKHKVSILPQIIVTPKAFEVFLKDNNLDQQLKHLLGTLNHERHDSLTQIALYARDLILRAPIGEDIHKPLYKKLEKLEGSDFTITANYFQDGRQIETKKWEGLKGEAVVAEKIRDAWANLYSQNHLKKHSIHHVNFHTFTVVLLITPHYEFDLTGHIKTASQIKGEFEIEAHTYVRYSYNKHSKKITAGKRLVSGGDNRLSPVDLKILLQYAHAVEKVVYMPQEVFWGKHKGDILVTGIEPLSEMQPRNDTYNSLVENLTVHPGITIGRLKVIDEKSQNVLEIHDEIIMLSKLDRKMLEIIKKAKGIILEEDPDPEVKNLLKSFGIPTVVKRNNRFLYSTGDVVSLNATTGEIKKGSMLVS